MKILITAFRPFGKRKNNTSQNVLQSLREFLPQQSSLEPHLLILPVNFHTAWPILEKVIQNISPDALLMLGEKGSKHTTLETTARNRRCHKTGEIEIEKTGGKKLRTIFDVGRLALALQKKTLKKPRCVVSHDAGSYLCNFVYWKALAHHPELPAIFLHVPALSAENSQRETPNIVQQVNVLIDAMKKQLHRMQNKVAAQKQLTVPRQKAGRAKRKKES